MGVLLCEIVVLAMAVVHQKVPVLVDRAPVELEEDCLGEESESTPGCLGEEFLGEPKE